MVWLPMLVTDSREAWSPEEVPHAAAQWWDGERVVGKFLANANLGGLGYAGVVWDAWFVFGPNAVWNDRLTQLVGSGSPVVESTTDLERALASVT